MKKLFKFGCGGLIALFVLVLIIGALGGNESSETNSEPKEETKSAEQKEKSKPAKTDVLTKEKFDQIKDGMTYEEVVKIVGSEGSIVSETGEKGTDLHTVMYDFETDGTISNASMMFQGGKLINKAQFGLGEDSDVEITLDQFNKLENGMTYEEVTKIIGGEGEVLSESGEKGSNLHTVMYMYKGKGDIGANANLTFQGNKLLNKSQLGLK